MQVRQPTVSQTLQQMIGAGTAEALTRRGREAIQYLMTGTARLALQEVYRPRIPSRADGA